ncbi:MAG TPA: hypothetical protein VFW34_05490 [Candidatus Rubrimentiphilum sp.]|nr:hypothetical protein [Candidatus Rubrimentiphilum sp.]
MTESSDAIKASVQVISAPIPASEELVKLLDDCGAVLRRLFSCLCLRLPFRQDDDSFISVWALGYIVILCDVCSSLKTLLTSGEHNRSILILRRVAFEYFVRFRFYCDDRSQAKVALDHATPEWKRFAARLWDEEVAIIEDPRFDEALHKSADSTHKEFWRIMNQVFSPEDAKRFYARFYMHPSWLAHGASAGMIDVLGVDDGRGVVHFTSKRKTDEIGFNAFVFLATFADDVAVTMKASEEAETKALLRAKNKFAADRGIEIIEAQKARKNDGSK